MTNTATRGATKSELTRERILDATAEVLNPALDVRAARMLVLGALNWTPEWWSPARGSLTRTIETAQLMVRRPLSPPEGPGLSDDIT